MKHKLFLLFLLLGAGYYGKSQWVLDSVPNERSGVSAIEWDNNVWFIGGRFSSYPFKTTDEILVYNCRLSQWDTTLQMAMPRSFTTPVAGDSGVYIAGGVLDQDSKIRRGTSVFDIYRNGQWRTESLPGKVFWGTAVKSGSKLIFGGFADSIVLYNAEIFANPRVFILDETTGAWSTSALSVPRTLLAAAANDSLVIFAGGFYGLGVASKRVDILNVRTGKWTIDSLSVPRGFIKGIFCNGKFYFAGGSYQGSVNESSDVVDVFDGKTWSTLKLSKPRSNMSIAKIGNKVYFIGGGDQDLSLFYSRDAFKNVDVYNTETGQWSRQDLIYATEGSSCATCGGKIVVGPGRRKVYMNNPFTGATRHIQILDVGLLGSKGISSSTGKLSAFPNPSAGEFTVLLPEPTGEIRITDPFGKVLQTHTVTDKSLNMDIREPGVYILYYGRPGQVLVQKVVVSP